VRGESFVAGELLVYRRDVYSHYDGLSIYSFQKFGAEQIRSLEVLDSDADPKWSELFEEIQIDERPVDVSPSNPGLSE